MAMIDSYEYCDYLKHPRKREDIYSFFCGEMREQVSEFEPKMSEMEMMEELSRLWAKIKSTNLINHWRKICDIKYRQFEEDKYNYSRQRVRWDRWMKPLLDGSGLPYDAASSVSIDRLRRFFWVFTKVTLGSFLAPNVRRLMAKYVLMPHEKLQLFMLKWLMKTHPRINIPNYIGESAIFASLPSHIKVRIQNELEYKGCDDVITKGITKGFHYIDGVDGEEYDTTNDRHQKEAEWENAEWLVGQLVPTDTNDIVRFNRSTNTITFNRKLLLWWISACASILW